MPEESKPERADDVTPAPVETREDAAQAEKFKDDPRNSIYAKYDEIKRAREAAETEALLPIVEELGGKIETIKTLQTPWTSGIRNLIYLRKVKSTAVTLPRLKRKTI
jgi:hypothetical protein